MAKRETAKRIIEAVAERRSRPGRPRRLGRKLTPEQRERRRQEAMDILWDAMPRAARVLADEAEKGNYQAALRIVEVTLARSEREQDTQMLAALSWIAKALEADVALRGASEEGTTDSGAGVQEEAV